MSLTLDEARERAALIDVASYEVRLDLTGTDGFVSRTTVRFGCRRPGATTFAELADARELTAALDGRPVAYANGRIELPDLRATNTLVVEARLPYVTDGEGMHVFVDPADGERYVSAYTGMDVARRVFCCFDQPDLKATITVSVDAEPRWTVLANGRELRRWGGHVEFARTPRIPTALFVVCAGPWASERFRHAGLEFGWHARASQAGALRRDLAELRAITTRCFDHYTAAFTPPYAFDSYDQVFVPGLNWGAQEQAGCVIHRGEYLPEAEPGAFDRMWRATTIAHEMAHMWFGDLATMRWWEDSWLNESFADYMGYQVAGAAAGFEGAWTDCAVARTPHAYEADDRRSTHPVAEDAAKVVDVDTAFGNFDMITYAKGCAVLRQLVTWLGEPDFLAGVNRYLTAHAFANADLADFVEALAGATDRDVRGWAAAWLRSTGYDTLVVDRDGEVPVLRRDGSRPHRVHVAGFDDAGGVAAERLVDLADEPIALPEFAGLAIVPDSRDETYARRRLDPASRDSLAATLGRIEPSLSRAALWSTFLADVRHADAPVSSFLDLVEAQLPDERDPLIVSGVLTSLTDVVLRRWVGPDDVADAEARVADVARRLLGSPEIDVWRQARHTLATVTIDRDELTRLRDTALADDVLRWRALGRMAARGLLRPADIDHELSLERSTTAELGALTAHAALPDPPAKAAAWARICTPGLPTREFGALAEGLWAGPVAPAVPYAERYIDDLPALAASGGQAFAQAIGRAFPWLPLPPDALTALRSHLAARLADDVLPTVLRRTWNDRLDDLDVALRVRATG